MATCIPWLGYGTVFVVKGNYCYRLFQVALLPAFAVHANN